MAVELDPSPRVARGGDRTRLYAAAALVLFWAALLAAIGAPVLALAPILIGIAVFVAVRFRSVRPAAITYPWRGRVRAAANASARLADVVVTNAPRPAAWLRRRALALAEERREQARLRELEAAREEARRMNAAASVYRRDELFEEAIGLGERALAALADLSAPRDEALTLNNLGLTHADRGDYAKAEECYLRALEIVRWIADPQAEGQVVANLGALRARQDREAEALEYWREALDRLDPSSPAYSRLAERVRAA